MPVLYDHVIASLDTEIQPTGNVVTKWEGGGSQWEFLSLPIQYLM
jgi:hypothetical protein